MPKKQIISLRNDEKLKNLTEELSSITDKVSNKEGVVCKERSRLAKKKQGFRRTEGQRTKGGIQMFKTATGVGKRTTGTREFLLEGQNRVNARMCRGLSGTMEVLEAQSWKPQDANQQRIWSLVEQVFGGPMLREALWQSQDFLLQRNWKRADDTRKTCHTKRCKPTKYSKQIKGRSI